MSPRPRLTEEETADHTHRLVEATFRVVAETGDASPPVRSILREADLGRQQFYRCFATKDDLMATVLAEGCRILASYLTSQMAKVDTPEEKVRAWVRGVLRQAQAATERTRPFIVGTPSPQTTGAARATELMLTAALAEVIADGVAAGVWTSSDPDADALVIYDFAFASMQRHLLRGVRPTRETVHRLGEFAVHGLVAAGARGRADIGERLP